MTRIRSYQFPLILFFLSLALRTAFLSLGPFHVDCLHLAIQAQQTLETGKLHYLFGPGYPLTVILGACFVFLAGMFDLHNPVFAVNLMSAVFSSMSVAVLFLLVQKLVDARAAFFSAFLFSIFPIFLTISVFGTSHTTSLFFLLAALVMLLNYLSTSDRQQLLFSGLLLGCMGASRIQDLLLMTIPVSVLFWFPSPKPVKILRTHYSPVEKARHFALLWSLALGTSLLFHLPLLLGADPQGYRLQMSRFWNIGVTENYVGPVSDSLLYSLQQIVFSMTPIGAVMGIAGWLLLISQDRRLLAFLALWFLIPLAFYGNLQTTEPRFLVVSSIPLIIGMGAFLSHLLSQKRALLDVGVIFTFSTVLLLLFVQTMPILRFRHLYTLLPDFARYVGEMTEPNAAVITADEGLFIKYYGPRRIVSRPRRMNYSVEDFENFSHQVDDLLKQGIPIYITSSGLFSYDPHRQLSAWLLLNYDLTFVGQHQSEDWHQGATRIRTGYEKLYRLTGR